NWPTHRPSRRVTLSDVKKSRGKRRYARIFTCSFRASLCQNVKVTHIRNRQNVRVDDNNMHTTQAENRAHIQQKISVTGC
ncbi:hypothetical protein, partial [Escherichia marmotae]